MIYLDYHATTPCDPAVLDAMWPWFARDFGNPHSTEHAPGRMAADAVENARAEIAALIGASPAESSSPAAPPRPIPGHQGCRAIRRPRGKATHRDRGKRA